MVSQVGGVSSGAGERPLAEKAGFRRTWRRSVGGACQGTHTFQELAGRSLRERGRGSSSGCGGARPRAGPRAGQGLSGKGGAENGAGLAART